MPITFSSIFGKLRVTGRDRHRVLGHDIPRPRLTGAGAAFLLIYLGLPVLVLGNLLDFLAQWLFGWCIGIWCVLAS